MASSLIRPAARLQSFSRVSIRRIATTSSSKASASAAAVSDTHTPSHTAFFPEEPEAPSVKTQIPGPNAQKYVAELGQVFETRSLNMPADYTKSFGN